MELAYCRRARAVVSLFRNNTNSTTISLSRVTMSDAAAVGVSLQENSSMSRISEAALYVSPTQPILPAALDI